MKDHNLSYWIYQKVITLQIRYTNRCLLKCHNPSYWIYIRSVYWLKMCLFIENVSIKWKYAFQLKWCILKGHNSLSINSGSYSFGNFFSTFSLSSFLKTQETCEFFSQISHSLPTPYRYFSTQWQFFVLIYTSYLKQWVDIET